MNVMSNRGQCPVPIRTFDMSDAGLKRGGGLGEVKVPQAVIGPRREWAK